MQEFQKPDTGFLGLGADSRKVQFWGRLANTDSNEEIVFGGGSHSNVLRQWAELAHWFPALSGPMGLKNFPNLPAQSGSRNCNFSGSNQGLSESHGYMQASPYSTVWSKWKNIKEFLNGQDSGCSE
jgi:hypothetical protein